MRKFTAQSGGGKCGSGYDGIDAPYKLRLQALRVVHYDERLPRCGRRDSSHPWPDGLGFERPRGVSLDDPEHGTRASPGARIYALHKILRLVKPLVRPVQPGSAYLANSEDQ